MFSFVFHTVYTVRFHMALCLGVLSACAPPEPELLAPVAPPEPELLAPVAPPEPELLAPIAPPEPELLAPVVPPEPELLAPVVPPEPELLAPVVPPILQTPNLQNNTTENQNTIADNPDPREPKIRAENGETRLENSMQTPQAQRIGILVPQKGEERSLGKSFIRVAYQAIFDHALEEQVFIFEDSGLTEKQAVRATKRLIEQDVSIILGPLTARQTNAVKPLLSETSLIMMSFSNNMHLAQENIYVFGFTPQEEVFRVFSYLYGKGYRRFAALTPDEPYGQAVNAALDAIRTAYPLISLQQKHYAETRDSQSIQSAIMNFVSQAEQGVSFDVLFLADRVEVSQFIVDFLQQQGMERSKYILVGPSFLWKNMTANVHPILLDSIFAAPLSDKQQDFIQTFQTTYGYPPPERALLMYDAVHMATILAQNNNASLPSLTGIHGPIALKSQGIVEHGLAIYVIEKDSQQIIDPVRQGALLPP